MTAANPSGAYGIPQALPGSKMASAGPDWQTSAATQIRWGLGYIKFNVRLAVRGLVARAGLRLVLRRQRQGTTSLARPDDSVAAPESRSRGGHCHFPGTGPGPGGAKCPGQDGPRGEM